MKTEWDSAKAASNLRKHGIDFSDAAVALEDRNALRIQRMIVHIAPHEDTVRIISARRADRKETGYYFDGISHE